MSVHWFHDRTVPMMGAEFPPVSSHSGPSCHGSAAHVDLLPLSRKCDSCTESLPICARMYAHPGTCSKLVSTAHTAFFNACLIPRKNFLPLPGQGPPCPATTQRSQLVIRVHFHLSSSNLKTLMGRQSDISFLAFNTLPSAMM
jgi:hypothetical protein